MIAACAKFVQRYGFSVNCRKNVSKRQLKVVVLYGYYVGKGSNRRLKTSDFMQ